ncbi:unnamed protein product [Trichobilharzia regenti]|nr:unnamed protein product [Trichobilharzia regenti]
MKLNAYCGSVSAPPSIVKLLIQLAIRSCNELQSISARFYSPDLRWILETGGIRIDATGATTSTTTSTTDDGIVSNAGNKGQTTTDEYMAPISPDDNTVACTDDLQNSSLCSKSWPKGSVCLAQVLSCTIKCLLGNCLTREITTFYQPTEKYLSLDFVESYEFMKIYNCIKTKYGDGFMNFIPEWINTVKNLFDSWDVFDHQQQYQLMQTQQQTQHQQQQLQQSNWWNSPTLSSADCDTHQEEASHTCSEDFTACYEQPLQGEWGCILFRG